MATLGAHLRRTTVSGLRVAFLSAFVLELVAMLGTAIVAVTIGLRLVTGSLDLATGFAVLIVTPEVYARLREVGVRYHASREGSLAVARVLDLLDTVPDPAVGGTRPAPARAVIRVRGAEVVADGREPALVDADLDVEPSRLTVLVGASGSGKTTLARVVAGLQRLGRGSVKVAGVDLLDVDPDSWRRQVAWVPAWPVAMTGTVRENLLIGSVEAIPDEHVWDVLTDVAADEWVRSLPDGLDTAIGPGHRDVSGGERARLGLARALLRSPRLLVIDEPLAHLDPATAAVVEVTLRGLVDTGTTVLVVSHDLGVALRADHVALLVDGRVVESGDPVRLATQPSLFAAHLAAAEVAA
jgi:ABC-type transport system involved in cytochrome bd biosynthesis fused ATPase/permease subunit